MPRPSRRSSRKDCARCSLSWSESPHSSIPLRATASFRNATRTRTAGLLERRGANVRCRLASEAGVGWALR